MFKRFLFGKEFMVIAFLLSMESYIQRLALNIADTNAAFRWF